MHIKNKIKKFDNEIYVFPSISIDKLNTQKNYDTYILKIALLKEISKQIKYNNRLLFLVLTSDVKLFVREKSVVAKNALKKSKL
jgi:hypothetical protein